MPLTFNLELLPLSDRHLIDALKQSAHGLPLSTKRLQWRIFDRDNASAPLEELEKKPELMDVLKEEGQILRWCQLSFQASPIGGVQPNEMNGNMTAERLPDGSLRFAASYPDAWNNNEALRAKAAINLARALTPHAKSNALAHLAPDLADFYTRRESTLVRLEELNTKITAENDQYRRALEASHDEKTKRLEDTNQERSQRLDEAYQNRLSALESEHRSKEEALGRKEAELDARKKLLDDRDNTHARRQIQQDLKAVLKERNAAFSLTKETVRKRRPTAAALISLMCALLAASAWALWSTTRPLPAGIPFWYPIARLAVSLSAFASSVVFYVRWQDRWSNAHAAEEFRLKRFDLDVARASWLVEVMLEWKAAKSEVPEELIRKLATGLFEQPTSEPLAKHPAEEVLGALLSSSKVNLKFPGGGLELNPKDIKAMNTKME